MLSKGLGDVKTKPNPVLHLLDGTFYCEIMYDPPSLTPISKFLKTDFHFTIKTHESFDHFIRTLATDPTGS